MNRFDEIAAKSSCDVYTLKIPEDMRHRCLWAKIIIDNDAYVLSCVSDCGNYAYRWLSKEKKTFKELLVTMDRRYLLRKIEPYRTVYNHDETISNLKKAIFEQRRERNITKEQARKDFTVIGEFEYDGSEDLLMERLMNHTTTFADDINWTADQMVKDYTPGAITFIEVLFPLLQEALKIELGIAE